MERQSTIEKEVIDKTPLVKCVGREGELNTAFKSASPYPHLVLDNFLTDEAAARALESFPDPTSDDWMHFKHLNERKLAQNAKALIPQPLLNIIDELSAPPFVTWLETVTGITGLRADDTLDGGGLHQSKRGGFLNLHADFTGHPTKKGWRRRVNVLVYLNRDWDEAWGGSLELWDRGMTHCVRKVSPIFNRCVIFQTDETSYHGHPEPMTCPESVSRRSIALYYFTDDATDEGLPTTYRPTPSDSVMKRVGIRLDNWALTVYALLRRKGILTDSAASSWLRKLFK